MIQAVLQRLEYVFSSNYFREIFDRNLASINSPAFIKLLIIKSKFKDYRG